VSTTATFSSGRIGALRHRTDTFVMISTWKGAARVNACGDCAEERESY